MEGLEKIKIFSRMIVYYFLFEMFIHLSVLYVCRQRKNGTERFVVFSLLN